MLDAASLDGANAWTRFWRMTLPLLRPTTLFLLIMNTLYASFETFGLVDITPEGGPGRATDLLIYQLYRDGFKSSSRIGLAFNSSIVACLPAATNTASRSTSYGSRRSISRPVG